MTLKNAIATRAVNALCRRGAYSSILVVCASLSFLPATGCHRAPSERTKDGQSSRPSSSHQQPAADYSIPTTAVTFVDLTTRARPGATLFQSIPSSQSGIHHTSRLDLSLPNRFLYASGMACGGVATGDVDGDGRPELFVCSGPGWNRLFHNQGDFKFADMTKQAGVSGGSAWGSGAAMIDIDNDGDLDIYVCNYDSPNQLFVNDGSGRFLDQADQYGLDVVDACLMPAFSDFDCDGDLDLYLLTLRYYRAEGFPQRARLVTENGRDVLAPELRKYYQLVQVDGRTKMEGIGRPDRLFRNNGDGSFTDVSEQAGIRGRGDGLSATWWDYNDDGYPDLYVGNDHDTADVLYRTPSSSIFLIRLGSPWVPMWAISTTTDCSTFFPRICRPRPISNRRP